MFAPIIFLLLPSFQNCKQNSYHKVLKLYGVPVWVGSELHSKELTYYCVRTDLALHCVAYCKCPR